MFEALETRTLFATGAVDASSVALYAPDGSATAIARHEPLWIVIHGMSSDKNDPSVQELAAAVQAGAPGDQALILDWGALATAQAAPDGASAYRNAWAAADKIASDLRAAHIPASRVNLIGFSMGSQIEDRLAKDLNSSAGKVNRLIAIDPAAPGYATNNRGHLSRHLPTFASDATYSIAFAGKDADSFYAAGISATDTVFLQGLTGGEVARHVETAYVFTRMMRRAAGLEPAGGDHVSALFSLDNISAGNIPAWRKDAYAPGYEAVMDCQLDTTDPLADFAPVSMTYINRRGHVQHV